MRTKFSQPGFGRAPATEDVAAFLRATPDAMRMLEDISRFISDWLPAFERDNRSYLTVAIGCTGGKHRSVAMAENLAAWLRFCLVTSLGYDIPRAVLTEIALPRSAPRGRWRLARGAAAPRPWSRCSPSSRM
mgnify:CR=1 FL=1